MHLPKIVIDVIPHKNHRYDTVGDYFKKKGEMHFRVSKMHDDLEFLVLIHELIEWYLIHKKGVSIKAIDDFDMKFEQHRVDESEPGDDPKAPYYDEHQFATAIEKLLADKLGVNWAKYDIHVREL